ncbi:hypothetical protein [Caldimonas brevitalea]|uniref:Uncharacterized protein n=1 Tax=Caldimonas brevitalea TaxID=413882 RepID=A0A0G3BSG9_9BURK|nr:hypothetical protein [Caldimonas brevitalea]AKJ29495.1 hypothetical protein AAW51_2804 [Caldimonas brevitalea]
MNDCTDATASSLAIDGPVPGPRLEVLITDPLKRWVHWQLETTINVLENAQSLRITQIEAARAARDRRHLAGEQVDTAEHPAQLADLLQALWCSDAADSLQYWHDVLDAVCRMHLDLIASVGAAADHSAAKAMRSAMAAVQGGLHEGLGPFDDLVNAAHYHCLAMPPANGPDCFRMRFG